MIQQTVAVYGPGTSTNVLPQFKITHGIDSEVVRADTFIIDDGALVFTAFGAGGRCVVKAFAPGRWTSFVQESPPCGA